MIQLQYRKCKKEIYKKFKGELNASNFALQIMIETIKTYRYEMVHPLLTSL